MLNNQMLYLGDPTVLEFQARVVEIKKLANGRIGVLLDRSYFYPTGGGQEHDNGTLNEAQVIDVFKADESELVVHIVDRALEIGEVIGKIDAGRRLRHMQHHTAQHLLTQCFVHLFDLDTLSANINGYSPSTLDLPTFDPSKDQLDQAENLANQFIYENRAVRSYFVSPDELSGLPLRRAPKVSKDIRIVEIEGFDYTPCGGTHCTATGQIGVIKIVKTEKQNERTRVHFAAGWQALELFQESYATVSGLATALSIGQSELSGMVLRQAETLQKTQKELQSRQIEMLTWEAERLTQGAEQILAHQVVLAVFEGRSPAEVRMLSSELAKKPGVIGVLASTDGQKFSLVVSCAEGSGLAARDLLAGLLAAFNGRGGGDARLAQGGGIAQEIQLLKSDLRFQLDDYFNKSAS